MSAVSWPRRAEGSAQLGVRKTGAERALGPVLFVAALFFVAEIFTNARGGLFGFDFEGSVWQAGQDILAGRSPYLEPDPATLLVPGNSFVYPPLIAVLAIPFAVMPFPIAIVLWDLVSAGALCLALRLVGLRDRRLYLLCLVSAPVGVGLILGQPDGLLALGCAVAWRYRDRRLVVGLAVGGLIALKLLFWPLLVWLLATRRARAAALAAAAAGAGIVGTWAAIGFDGFTSYPALLSALADAFQDRTHSVVALALRLGAPETPARLLALAAGGGVLLAALYLARRADGDRRSFAAAIGAGLLMSPILHMHYVVQLFVPLAIARRHPGAPWLLVALLWLSPIEPPPQTWRLLAGLGLAVALLAAAMRSSQKEQEAAAANVLAVRAG